MLGISSVVASSTVPPPQADSPFAHCCPLQSNASRTHWPGPRRRCSAIPSPRPVGPPARCLLIPLRGVTHVGGQQNLERASTESRLRACEISCAARNRAGNPDLVWRLTSSLACRRACSFARPPPRGCARRAVSVPRAPRWHISSQAGKIGMRAAGRSSVKLGLLLFWAWLLVS